jgi:hypothetical protein
LFSLLNFLMLIFRFISEVFHLKSDRLLVPLSKEVTRG